VKSLIAVLTSILLIGCASQPEPQTTAAAQSTDGRARLIVFGDSISYCQTCFPSLIAAALPNLRVDNRAEPGTALNSEWQIDRIMAASIQPSDRVVFLTGYNDIRGHGLDPVWHADYVVTLRKALVHLASSGQPIYVGVFMKSLCVDAASIARNGGGCVAGANDLYADSIRAEVAALNAPNVHLVDVNAQWVPSYDNLDDMVHPKPSGYADLARMFLEVMQ